MKQINLNINQNFRQRYLILANEDASYNLIFTHKKPHKKSDIGIAIVALNESVVAVNATVVIDKKAFGSDAQLSIIAINDPKAKIIASPNLEINNNNVKAGHSLKTFQIDDTNLFYLATRGINSELARQELINNLILEYKTII